MVVINRMVGKDENSNGLRMNTAVIRIRIEKLSEKANETSNSQVGSGTISPTRIAMMPTASARSDFLMKSKTLAGDRSMPVLVVPMSDIQINLGLAGCPLFAVVWDRQAGVGIFPELVAQGA